jgi:DNA repair protein RecN (Recombination protein N)
MLTLLHIENIAVVERADIEPGPGFNVLTGETGAGKSIIIDSIGAILGERTPRDLIRSGEKTASVSAVFTGLSATAVRWLEDNGYSADEDGNLLIMRQFSAEGKNLCKINGLPVTVSLLKMLGSCLVNIHGQHDNQSLLDETSHIVYLDSFAAHRDLLDRYRASYETYRDIQIEIKHMSLDEDEKTKTIDRLRYRIEEIESAALQPGEDERLEARRTILRSSERMTSAIEESFQALYGDEDAEGACSLINTAGQALSMITSIDGQLQPLYSRIEELKYAAEDIAAEIRDLREEYAYSPEEMESIESRLDLIHKLKRKYGNTIEEILECLSRDQADLNTIEFSEEALHKLQIKLDAAFNETSALAVELSKSRALAGELLSEKIMRSLEQLDMPKVRFAVLIEKLDEMGSAGTDSVRFLLSANAGEEPRSISRIASGGELSRIMLAMKNVLAENDDIQTLIFDEVDSGVSGRAAQRVAEKLAEVSRSKQVLCVTHLPQLAAMADHHFKIEKSEKNGRTYTSVTLLDEGEAANEIARIISGANITETTLKNAYEMIEASRSFKKVNDTGNK